jgi:hypothetical protein
MLCLFFLWYFISLSKVFAWWANPSYYSRLQNRLCRLSTILVSSTWPKMDLTMLKGKRFCEIFRLVTRCTPINDISISIFSPLYTMVRGMKFPFESSFWGRSCTWFWCICWSNILVDMEDSFKPVKVLRIAGEHWNAARGNVAGEAARDYLNTGHLIWV